MARALIGSRAPVCSTSSSSGLSSSAMKRRTVSIIIFCSSFSAKSMSGSNKLGGGVLHHPKKVLGKTGQCLQALLNQRAPKKKGSRDRVDGVELHMGGWFQSPRNWRLFCRHRPAHSRGGQWASRPKCTTSTLTGRSAGKAWNRPRTSMLPSPGCSLSQRAV